VDRHRARPKKQRCRHRQTRMTSTRKSHFERSEENGKPKTEARR
jgi:hypothetical protein